MNIKEDTGGGRERGGTHVGTIKSEFLYYVVRKLLLLLLDISGQEIFSEEYEGPPLSKTKRTAYARVLRSRVRETVRGFRGGRRRAV